MTAKSQDIMSMNNESLFAYTFKKLTKKEPLTLQTYWINVVLLVVHSVSSFGVHFSLYQFTSSRLSLPVMNRDKTGASSV